MIVTLSYYFADVLLHKRVGRLYLKVADLDEKRKHDWIGCAKKKTI